MLKHVLIFVINPCLFLCQNYVKDAEATESCFRVDTCMLVPKENPNTLIDSKEKEGGA